MKKYKKHFAIILCLLVIGASGTLFFSAEKKNKDFDVQFRNSFVVSKMVQFGNSVAFAFRKHDATKIGWITDIHADRFKHRDVDSGLLYPRRYSDYLPQVFDDLRSQGINTVIATGDNTNSGDVNYARELKRIANEKNMKVIWVKGNHDNDAVMSVLGVTGGQYYFVDYEDTRIIALNNVENDGGYYGSIDQDQIEWLKRMLKTEKQVIVAMHIPIFSEGDISKIHDMKYGDILNVGNILDRYVELENILNASGNVKMVISGHWHLPWHKEYNGINYYSEAALTREGYSGAYSVIDLKDNSVEYLFAKLKK